MVALLHFVVMTYSHRMKCPNCDFEHDKLISLSLHFRHNHGTAKDLYVVMNCDGKIPTCKCGCGIETRFYDITRGFSDYVKGHQSRVHNNWGHNKAALDKSHATTRARYANDDLDVWNKNLDTETDERVKSYGQSISKTILSNPTERERRSKDLTRRRLSREIPNLYGPAHPQWKGGTSALSAHCHGNTKLYKDWKFPKLVGANFKCSRCPSYDELCVHHDQEKMADIIRKIAAEFDYIGQDDVGLKTRIAEAVADYHVANVVSGVVLCRDCHDLEHEHLNFPRRPKKVPT